MKDEGINTYFREMENPQHDAWEPERHSEPAEAKKNKKRLFRYIKESVLELGRKTTIAESDAEGVGDYLPDDIVPEKGADKQETIADSTKSIDLSMSGLKSVQKGFEKAVSTVSVGIEDSEGIPDEEQFGDIGSKDYGSEGHHVSKQGSGYGSNPGINGNGTNLYETGSNGEPSISIKKKFKIYTLSVRLALLDKVHNRYRLIFTPEKTAGSGYLQFRLSGEQSNIAVNVSAAINRETGVVLRTFKNVIYLDNIVTKNKMAVEFNVDYNECGSMEVSLYGYKI